MQGDSDLANIYKHLGVETQYTEDGIQLQPNSRTCKRFEYNFINCPDIIQTVAVTCCFKGIPFKISGAETLRIKETDRIYALQKELGKFGFEIKELTAGTIEWDGKRTSQLMENIEIETYDDHRMAMAFAPIAINEPLSIKDPMVVTKSYPGFWDDLNLAGFRF